MLLNNNYIRVYGSVINQSESIVKVVKVVKDKSKEKENNFYAAKEASIEKKYWNNLQARIFVWVNYYLHARYTHTRNRARNLSSPGPR